MDILWLIYINDLTDALPEQAQIGSSLFADDLAMTATAKTVHQCTTKMQPALDALEKWCHSNKVTMHKHMRGSSLKDCVLPIYKRPQGEQRQMPTKPHPKRDADSHNL